ncbi:uncharacterized protein LOC124636291 [Helicoverpa zea]|uniref:uncharacterized protein LOC124636291 n=1 Tax=Helicoverpa zea TaxID=7113 RepID=UPI001F56B08C|nr:uncharacterized protein LOC124636291 [Helicoverpa zea]
MSIKLNDKESAKTFNIFLAVQKNMYVILNLWLLVIVFSIAEAQDYGAVKPLKFRMNPAPDGHRCGVCPTYFQKICAFDFTSNSTFIFDNHCVMDLYNCMERTAFFPMKYEKCLFFGNFAYVHGFKHEDIDYGEDHVVVKQSKKTPDFI